MVASQRNTSVLFPRLLCLALAAVGFLLVRQAIGHGELPSYLSESRAAVACETAAQPKEEPASRNHGSLTADADRQADEQLACTDRPDKNG
jgi:hypothetical protein